MLILRIHGSVSVQCFDILAKRCGEKGRLEVKLVMQCPLCAPSIMSMCGVTFALPTVGRVLWGQGCDAVTLGEELGEISTLIDKAKSLAFIYLFACLGCIPERNPFTQRNCRQPIAEVVVRFIFLNCIVLW